jgi:uncharacterized protein
VRQPPSIDAIGGGGFRVSGQRHEGSLLILDDVASPWAALKLDALTPADFQAVFDAPAGVVEFVLLGTGATQSLPPRAVREAMMAAGLGFEFMATQAAAKTYNFLASEGRRLACCLIAV